MRVAGTLVTPILIEVKKVGLLATELRVRTKNPPPGERDGWETVIVRTGDTVHVTVTTHLNRED